MKLLLLLPVVVEFGEFPEPAELLLLLALELELPLKKEIKTKKHVLNEQIAFKAKIDFEFLNCKKNR